MRIRANVALVALALGGGVSSFPAIAQPVDTSVPPEMRAFARAVQDGAEWPQPTVEETEQPAAVPQADERPFADEPSEILPSVEGTEQPEPEPQPGEQVFAVDQPSEPALQVVEWVKVSRDNGDWPFIVIDKDTAAVFVFDAAGELLGASPALLGIAQGDDSTPGIGERTLASMGPAEKTTPAGRFVARIGPAVGNQRVLWVDFSTSVALHPVVTGNRKEKRLERLNSPTPDDNRITFGCINVPAAFFKDVIQPNFTDTSGIVYILPDTKFLFEVFPTFEVAQRPGAAPEATLSDSAAE